MTVPLQVDTFNNWAKGGTNYGLAVTASCGGKVNFDCDDFPEDCDEPCCPCSTC